MVQKRSTIGAIVLAAGMSKRMGAPKLLLSLHGKSIIRHTVDHVVSQPLSPICIVTGYHLKEIQEKLSDLPEVDIVYNADFSQGMSTSLKCGIQHMQGLTEATIIYLADQPLVDNHVTQSLIDIYQEEKETGTLIVRPIYQDTLGHPVLIDNSLYDEFKVVTGDIGGKQILKKYEKQTTSIVFAEAIWGKDIDTKEDYLNMKKHLGG